MLIREVTKYETDVKSQLALLCSVCFATLFLIFLSMKRAAQKTLDSFFKSSENGPKMVKVSERTTLHPP